MQITDVMLDKTDILYQIGEALNVLPGKDLEKLHRELCGSEVVYIGGTLFATTQAILDRAKEINGG